MIQEIIAPDNLMISCCAGIIDTKFALNSFGSELTFDTHKHQNQENGLKKLLSKKFH